ncbi:MAG: B12-binding domain-containing radical SAM protein [Planctomycetes bacterium]|nr:B12-binding domain-containing radical SAM protein [Planctomycetota bacterium]
MKLVIDVLLINPPTPVFMDNKEFMFPPSLLYLASYASQFGYSATLLDLNLHLNKANSTIPCDYDVYLDIVCERVRRDHPAVIGLGCLFSGQFPFVNAAARRIKATCSDVVICVGGIHPTIFAKDILEHCPDIDFVVSGEGEEQFVEILHQSKDPEHSITCEGIGYRDHGHIVFREKHCFIQNLDSLPMPDYSLVNFDAYRHDLSKWHNPKGQVFDSSVPLITSRSCPNRCNFCSMFLVMGLKFRARSADNVLQELEYLYHVHNVRHFSIMDDNFTFSKKRTLQICNEIIRRKLDIQFDTPNGLMVRTLDQEVVDAMAEAGWVRGSIAIESGSDYIRNKVIGKGLQRETIFEVLGFISRHPQVFLRAYFIMGFPEETHQTLADTWDMIEEMHIDDIYVNNLLPFPGTKLYAQCVRDNLLLKVAPRNIWQADFLYMNGNDEFFIKPYAMTVEELAVYRKRFNVLLTSKRKKARERRTAWNLSRQDHASAANPALN